MPPSPPPAGTTPIGAFLIPVPPEDPGNFGVLADAIDPDTGEYLSILSGFDPLDAWVMQQFMVTRGSGSAVLEHGKDFSDVTHQTPWHEEVFRQEILRPLKPVIESKEIVVKRVEVRAEGDALVGYLTYRNVARDTERTISTRGN